MMALLWNLDNLGPSEVKQVEVALVIFPTRDEESS